MSLAKGTLLGPYEVDVLLGAGGMGEVYRARDTRLGRTVAIKVLLSGLTASAERRARFEREARAISALSNPHICALYDIGRADDTEYLVMEYLEGETLADRIARGRLPLSQVLRFGAEIAQALHHAHRAGITHRDLKPGNIMITSSGVKLLDFGLAKLTEPDRVPIDRAAATTLVNPLTAEGMVVGTVVYMSPEQLEGKSIDHRTDIFSLGCVLYEMATGQRPFSGGSAAAISAAILSSDPVPLRSLQPAFPPALERIILTALEKNAEDRWQTAQDVARQLRWLSESSSSGEGHVVVGPDRSRGRLFAALAIAAVLGGLLACAAVRFFASRAAIPTKASLHLSPPEEIQAAPSPEATNFALSPDGQTLCFLGIHKGRMALYLRRLDSFDVRKIEGPERPSDPFWSSDGEWIGFSAQGKLWKVKIAPGSVPEALTDIWPSGAIASWVGNTILFADHAGGRSEIYRISDQGGAPAKLTTLKAGEWRHTWPRLLADGHHFIYWAAAINSLGRQILLADLESQASSVLVRNVSQANLVRDDQLVFVRDAKLFAQRFDIGKGAMIGQPTRIADDVAYFYPSGRGDFDAANGVIVYRTDTRTGRLITTDRKGTARTIDEGLFDDLSLSYSIDGKRAAVTVLDRMTGLGDIWIYDLARRVRDRFTSDPGLAVTPVWSPDGRSIVYSQAGVGTLPRLLHRSLTSSVSEELTPKGTFQFAGNFSPDGSTLYFTQTNPRTTADIFRLDMRTKKIEPVLNSSDFESEPSVSPDGRWMAFSSYAAGANEIYLFSLTDKDMPRVRISTNGGDNARWRRDGHELFYISGQGSIMSAVPRIAGDWTDTNSTELFRAPANMLRFDVSPDGQSFLFVQESHPATDSLFHVILGWQ